MMGEFIATIFLIVRDRSPDGSYPARVKNALLALTIILSTSPVASFDSGNQEAFADTLLDYLKCNVQQVWFKIIDRLMNSTRSLPYNASEAFFYYQYTLIQKFHLLERPIAD